MNAARDNIDPRLPRVVRAALTPPGWHRGAQKPGWWDVIVGPGRAFDTDRDCVICTQRPRRVLRHHGARVNRPGDGASVRRGFPVVTVADMVTSQKLSARPSRRHAL